MNEAESRKRGRPRAFNSKDEGNIVQALDKALVVLKIVAKGTGLSLTEIAEAAQTPAPTVYRALITLQKHGIVSFDDSAQLWRVGVEAFRVGNAFLTNTSIIEQARPRLQSLMNDTGETANIGVISDDEVVFLAQAETHQPIRAFFRPGTNAAIHASGIGKAVFAFMNEKSAAALAARIQLEGFTDKTVRDEDALMAMRGITRSLGYAVDDEERTLGMRCIAAPIFNNFGEAVAAISVSGPTVRMPDDTVERLASKVVTAANSITRDIGGNQPEL